MVNALVEAALAAKLDPQGIDLTPFAVTRAVGTGDAGLDLDSSGDEAIVDIGAQVTSICVHDHGVIRFVRMLPSGGRDITLALASRLGVDDEVAERLKRGERLRGFADAAPAVESLADGAPAGRPPAPADAIATGTLPSDTPPADTPSVQAPRGVPGVLSDPAQVRDLALTRAGSFVDEVRASLEFYTALMPNAQVGRVLVVGGGSRLDGLLELLQERLQVPVDRGRLFERAKSEIELSAEASVEAEAVLSVAVGLAIPARMAA
jgi:type IV pilus assembly protein PilM